MSTMRDGIQRWANVPGVLTINAAFEDDDLWDLDREESIRRYVPDAATVDGLEIHFQSAGYYDPGCRYGDPDRCYPPEGDDERTLVYVIATHEDGRRVRLEAEEAEALFEAYRDEIDELELDTRD